MAKLNSGQNQTPATREDTQSVFGGIDHRKLIEILSLRPTVAELEEASIWLAGDADIYEADHPIGGTASKIVAILTADEEQEFRTQ